jgi:RHS repeat-associated protein
MLQAIFPYGGYLKWGYGNVTYSSGSTQREVQSRILSMNGTAAAEKDYSLIHESSTSSHPVHLCTSMIDAGGVGMKQWIFSQSGSNIGLVSTYQGQQVSGGPPSNCTSPASGSTALTENDFTWTQDSANDFYIGTVITTLGTGSSQIQTRTDQTVDTHGNVTQVKNYNYGNTTTPARTSNYTYLASSTYTSLYMYNLLELATVTDGTNSAQLTYNLYDQPGSGGSITGTLWDSTVTGRVRGNLTESMPPSASVNYWTYDGGGNVVTATVNGVTTAASTTSTTNFAAPSQLSVGTATAALTYSTFLGFASGTGQNGDYASVSYDSYGRPTGATSPFGAATSYTYNAGPYSSTNPATVTTTTNGRWTLTTLDGFGRSIQVQTGYGTTTLSSSESVYAPCACSPLGKLTSQTTPHAPGPALSTTTYSYDGIGRTLQKATAGSDTSGTTTYSYAGNVITTTDPAGVWKQFTMDPFSNLLQVTEPNPANPTGSTFVTNYTYDVMNHLTQVSMTRPTGSQTRTFNYYSSTNVVNANLQSATNPENGTVSYTYNSYNKVATKTDAKGQQVVYTYDTYGRLTEVQRYPQGIASGEDVCQQEDYSYDTNPYDSTYSQYATGRLTAVLYYLGTGSPGNGSCPGTTFIDMYSYSVPGEKTGKLLRVIRSSQNVDLNSTYTYDNEGRMLTIQYPNSGTTSSPVTGPNLGWAYDTMGRLNTMTDLAAGASIITGTTYGPSNQMLTMTGAGGAGGPSSETRTYNSMVQLTQLTVTNSAGYVVNMTYTFSSTQNNGKITSQSDAISGETVQYTYDSLNRLASAQSTSGSWGQSYSYDGFGNLTGQTVTAGSAPAYSAVFNAATNQPSGYGVADANGNMNGFGNYDVANQFIGQYGNFQYSYAPGNKRVWRGVWTSGTLTTDEVTFWSPSGQKLATYQMTLSGTQWYAAQTGTNYYFGSKLIKNAGGYVGADRLGSIGHFYPWGQEKPSATTNGTEKFTGYFRDAETGLDYAKNRYHNPGTGRFLTPDPYMATPTSATSPTDPGSWNRYAYVGGDPINRKDPTGRDYCDADDWFDADCYIDYGSVGVQGPPANLGIYLGIQIAAELDPIWGNDAPNSGAGGTSDCPTYSSSFAFYVCFHQSGADWTSFTASLTRLDKRLDRDPTCEKFLTANGVSMTQINSYLTDPATTFTLANLILSFNPPNILAGTTNDVPSQTPIIINSSAYQGMSQYEQFLTILHELGHYTGVLAGDHGSGAGTTSTDNDNLVIQNCSKTLGRQL